jgi:hypothetical protein
LNWKKRFPGQENHSSAAERDLPAWEVAFLREKVRFHRVKAGFPQKK